MPINFNLDSLANEMMAAQDAVRQIEPFTARFQEFDLQSAYLIADIIHRARLDRGAIPVGRKIGFTNPDMWIKYGVVEPIWAYVYDTTVAQLSRLHAQCSIGRFCEPKIEPEIVFHLCSDLSGDVRLENVVNAIDWVTHGFEIVQSHFPGWHFQAPDTVADWALHGTLLLGPPQSLHMLGSDPVAALESFSIDLLCDGQLIETGKGSNVLGNPFAAVLHLVSVLSRQSAQAHLKAGEIITTGTITTAQSVHLGQTWKSDIVGAELSGLEVECVL